MAGGTDETVPSTTMEATPAIDTAHRRHRRVRAAAASAAGRRIARSGPSPTPSRCRSRDACASRGRSSRSRSRSPSSRPSSAINGAQLSQRPEPHPRGRTRCSSWRRSWSSTPGSRCAACAGRSCCAGPASTSPTKDSTEIIFLSWLVNCVVPAKLGDVYRAYLLKINSTGLAVADIRDRVHRARPRPVRHRHPRPRGRLLELPERAAAGHPDRVRHRRRSWSWSSRSRCSRCATSGGGSSSRCRCRTRSSSCTTASRRASSGRSSRAICRSSAC